MAKQVDLVYTVTVKAVLVEGRESTRERIAEEIRGHLEDDSDPVAVYGDKDGKYDITEWVVSLKT